ncbi:MAG: bifunctional diaminohydroxyphosphoribosylaminopyrimidine deaminase/5-amino-6-(5-phosphoribosylamino)uracil reductase RibD [Azospirillaceae bacterium]|nr:bifunctional diaminohydroxyphosphoribosylaminopyrimidine deaminase/5-amino-6-(5-phosphoribosylamino)uracil reductase RibD [Azospirillaceae bacterium]
MADIDDIAAMRAALGLARRGLGTVAPNPAVGCVLVRDGYVVGRGWTQPGGRPHAETEALARAGDRARGATAYVTLEPCSHHGRTGPCADALIQAGIRRAVIACVDPDPRVHGAGIARLRDSGVAVELGLCGDEAYHLNEGFFLRVTADRPLVTLKVASTLDGRIATHKGDSHWITGEVARAWGHRLRADHDAIMVGIGTALADDPELTCRLPGLMPRSPLRVVADSRLRLSLTSRLVRGAARYPTAVICLARGQEPARRQAFLDCGVTLIEVGTDSRGEPDIKAALSILARRGISRVLVEGGSRLAATMLRGALVDRLEWFRAARLIGGDGVAAMVGFGVDFLADTVDFALVRARRAGADIVESYERRA